METLEPSTLARRRGRRFIRLPLADDDRASLHRLARRYSDNRALALRFEIVLACADVGGTYGDLAAHLDCSAATVSKWRRTYIRRGLDGLAVPPSIGGGVDDDVVDAVVREALASDPFAESCLSSRQVAATHGVSHTTVSEIWRSFRVTPWLQSDGGDSVRDHLRSGDAVLIGRYSNPPVDGVAYTIDDVGPGQIHSDLPWCGEGGRTDPSVDLVDFLEALDATTFGHEIHVLLDDLKENRTRAIHKWLLGHRRIHVHFASGGERWSDIVPREWSPVGHHGEGAAG